MNLDDHELEIALLALSRFEQELQSQVAGQGSYTRVWASAWHACRHCRDKALALIVRIEQHQKDVENGDVR